MGLNRIEMRQAKREILEEGLIRAIQRSDRNVNVENRIKRRRRRLLILLCDGMFNDNRNRVKGRRTLCEEVLYDVSTTSSAIRDANIERRILRMRMIIINRARNARSGLINLNARNCINRCLIRQLIKINGRKGLLAECRYIIRISANGAYYGRLEKLLAACKIR